MQIGYNQTLDANFFSECERKIINLIHGGSLSSLLITSKNELLNPSIRNRRYEVYTKYILPFYQKTITESDNCKNILNSKKRCQTIIERVFYLLDGDSKEFFEKLGIKATIDKIWELCYIYSL
jgi:hypothetical protein